MITKLFFLLYFNEGVSGEQLVKVFSIERKPTIIEMYTVTILEYKMNQVNVPS